MAGGTKKRLHLTTLIYWVLLSYIIAALLWWFLSLYKQNEDMYELRKENLSHLYHPGSAGYDEGLSRIDSLRKRNNAKFIGEGSTFLILLLFGAVYLYRSVRSQFRAQQQQQNFVMAITHELKTPISVSRLNLETLQRYQLDEKKKEKLLQMTLQETLRLDGLINNILITSQLDGHSYHISKEELNFSDLVQDVVNQFATRYTERKMVQQIDQDIELNGDPLLLKLLVSNLLENANKYSPREKPIALQLHQENHNVLLSVRDEGSGIQPSERKNVFRKFYRIGNQQTRTTKGTGLGLYLCKKIAEDHNGQISIADNQPQGSNFIVNFSV
jgi:two-component system, OmpR family, sensor histidine kinase CiaH